MKKTNLTVVMLATLLFGFLMAVPNSAFATPIKVTVTHTDETATVAFAGFESGNWVNAYTEYTLETDLFGNLDAFCVQGVAASTQEQDYEILPVPEHLNQAAWLAEQWWTGNYSSWELTNPTKEDFQIAIWEIVLDDTIDLTDGNFRYDNSSNTANLANINNILGQEFGTTSDNVSWVHNPVGEYDNDTYPGPGYQDYLVKHSVPEPTTMLLLGFSILVLGVCRKSFFGFNKI